MNYFPEGHRWFLYAVRYLSRFDCMWVVNMSNETSIILFSFQLRHLLTWWALSDPLIVTGPWRQHATTRLSSWQPTYGASICLPWYYTVVVWSSSLYVMCVWVPSLNSVKFLVRSLGPGLLYFNLISGVFDNSSRTWVGIVMS